MIVLRSLSATTKYISQFDPALDHGHADFSWDRYRDTGDAAHLPIVPGATPTVFELAPLTASQLARVLASTESQFAHCLEAVAYGLRGASNLRDGEASIAIEHHTVSGLRRLRPASLDQIRDPRLVLELGARILELCHLDPTRG